MTELISWSTENIQLEIFFLNSWRVGVQDRERAEIKVVVKTRCC